MAYIQKDRVKETTTTNGTGAVTLAGAVAGFQAFSAVMSVADTCYYVIVSATGTDWETGTGTYSSASVLTRTTVLSSSNSGNAVSFTSGTKDVFMGPVAERVTDIAHGGTGATTAAQARTNLGVSTGTVTSVSGAGTVSGLTLTGTVTSSGSLTLGGAISTLNQNTTGNAATVTTNANLTGHITSVGNAAVLGSFTSAQLAGALTDETGTGAAVFATSPTLVTPLANSLSAVPRVGTGAGNSLTISADNGVTTGAGGSLILQAGIQATSGGDGSVTVQQVAGQTSSLLFVKSSANDDLLTVFNNGDITLRPKASASSSTVPVLSGIRPGGQAGWKLNDSGFKFSDPGNPDHFMTLGSGTNISTGLRFNYDNSCTFAAGSNRDFGAMLWTSNQGAGYPLLGRRFAFISSTVAAQSSVGSSLPVVGELFSFGVNGINYWPNIISLSSNVNDLVHTGAAELRINCTVASDITGIKYGFGRHMDGRVVGLRNTGTANLTIRNKNSGSYQNNRLITDTGFDHIVAPGNVSSLVYDLTANNGSTGISITNVSRTSNVATFTTSTEAFVRAGYTVVISGMSDASFNGTYISSNDNDYFSNGQLTFTLPNTGSNLGTTAMSGLAIVMGGWRVNGFSSVNTSTSVLTVATLPAAATAGAGARAFVSDSTATTFAAIVAGGGANGVPVYSDGTNWRIG